MLKCFLHEMEASHVIFQAPATDGDDSRQVSYLIIPDSDGGVVVKLLTEFRCNNENEAISILKRMHPDLGMRKYKLIGRGPIGPSELT
jgi:hypothetical protein